MKLNTLIAVLQQLEKELGNVDVVIAEVEEGPNASNRYGVGTGLKVGDVEVKELQYYVETGCIW